MIRFKLPNQRFQAADPVPVRDHSEVGEVQLEFVEMIYQNFLLGLISRTFVDTPQ